MERNNSLRFCLIILLAALGMLLSACDPTAATGSGVVAP